MNKKQWIVFLFVLLTATLTGMLATTGRAAGHGRAAPVGTIAPLNWPFTAVEGQSFTGIVAAFTDSDAIGVGNFITVSINWGDLSISSGAIYQSGVDTHLFFVVGTHIYAEEGSDFVSVSFHDVNDNINVNLPASIATVEDAPLCVCPTVTPGAPSIFSGIGGTNVGGGAVNAMLNFETAIGGVNNGANPPPQASGFRTITWDGIKLDGTDFGGGGSTFVINLNKTVGIPVNRFQERGVYFDRVYAVSNDRFEDVNPGATGVFTSFSPLIDFAPFNTNEVDLVMVLSSLHTNTAVPAATRGFGGIFINVHNTDQTSIEYFAGPISLGRFYVPAGPVTNPAYTFYGVLFGQPIVTRVHLTLGSGAIFRFDGTTFAAGATDNVPTSANVVALDDLAYAEPQPLSPAPIVTITPTVGVPFTGTVGTFIDTDPNGNAHDFTAMIDWGDGHTSPGTISAAGGGGFNVSGSNTYATAGPFQFTFTVQDFGGAKVVGSATSRAPLFLPIIVK